MADKEETYSEAETDARREAALKRMLATPHKPHKEQQKGREKKPAPSRTVKQTTA